MVGMEDSSTITFSIWQEGEQTMPVQDVGQLALHDFAKMHTVRLPLLTQQAFTVANKQSSSAFLVAQPILYASPSHLTCPSDLLFVLI